MVFQPSLYLGDFNLAAGSFGTGSGLQVLFAANPRAVYRSVTNRTSNVLFISTDGGLTFNDGNWSIPVDGTMEWFWERHGLLVTLPLFFFSAAPIGNVNWLEMWFQPGVIDPQTEGG